jgi:hypothetical protein
MVRINDLPSFSLPNEFNQRKTAARSKEKKKSENVDYTPVVAPCWVAGRWLFLPSESHKSYQVIITCRNPSTLLPIQVQA